MLILIPVFLIVGFCCFCIGYTCYLLGQDSRDVDVVKAFNEGFAAGLKDPDKPATKGCVHNVWGVVAGKDNGPDEVVCLDCGKNV